MQARDLLAKELDLIEIVRTLRYHNKAISLLFEPSKVDKLIAMSQFKIVRD